jgi:hypothetical protein
MRASSVGPALVIVVACATSSARASEPTPQTTPSATPPSKTAAASPAKTSTSATPPNASEAKKSHSESAKELSRGTAVPAAHSSATAAKDAAAGGPVKPDAVTLAANNDGPKQETLEEIVARVRRRLALERAPKRSASAPSMPHAAAPTRVTLVWRPYIVWPEELTAAPADPAKSSSNDRVTLKWESDEQ